METWVRNGPVHRDDFKSQEENHAFSSAGAAGLSGSAVVREFANRGNCRKFEALVRNLDRAGAFVDLPNPSRWPGPTLTKPGEMLTAALEGVDRALMISTADPQMLEAQLHIHRRVQGGRRQSHREILWGGGRLRPR